MIRAWMHRFSSLLSQARGRARVRMVRTHPRVARLAGVFARPVFGSRSTIARPVHLLGRTAGSEVLMTKRTIVVSDLRTKRRAETGRHAWVRVAACRVPASKAESGWWGRAVFGVSESPVGYYRFLNAQYQAIRNYHARPYPGRLTLFRARTRPLFRAHEPDLNWAQLAGEGVEIHLVPGCHRNIFNEPFVRHLANALKACFRNTTTQAGRTCNVSELASTASGSTDLSRSK